MKTDKIWETAEEAYRIEADGIEKAFLGLDKKEFKRAVDALASAVRIGASGCGHSGICCRHFAHLMCCIERPARFISPAEAVHGAMGYMQKGDVMMLASRGGKTSELLPILDICRRKGVTVITATENLDSPLAKGADIVLRTPVTRETDRWNSQGTTSFTVVSVLFDALQAALVEKTGFRNEQFAVIHPGGAVGERLNHKALVTAGNPAAASEAPKTGKKAKTSGPAKKSTAAKKRGARVSVRAGAAGPAADKTARPAKRAK